MADFSRIRKANLGRLTTDRLTSILSRLGQEAEVSVDVHLRRTVVPMHPAVMSAAGEDRPPNRRWGTARMTPCRQRDCGMARGLRAWCQELLACAEAHLSQGVLL